MQDLAKHCRETKQPAEATRIELLAKPVDPRTVRFAPLPRNARPELPTDLSAEDRYKESQLQKHQTDYAKGLYLISRQAVNAGYFGLAYDLVCETARHDPDHAAARKVLGFQRVGDEWLSPFEAKMKRESKVWNPKFGWLAAKDQQRYESGERYFNRKWMSAADEEKLRSNASFKQPWEIRTEHFLVKTNHSLERGAELAAQLEAFYGLCRQTLAGFFFSSDQLKQLFDGKTFATSIQGKPSEVHYYRTKDQYMTVLKKLTDQPVEITKGIYFPSTQIAYFYDDPNANNESTLYHEATHLLLSGARPQVGLVGERRNFWIIEGIACYMESVHRDGTQLTVGDATHDRIRAARQHLINDQYYVPLDEYASMGMIAFQSAQQIRKNYSQSAALTHFFLHYDGGKYRDALIEHLSQLYSPNERVRQDPQTLAELTGVPDHVLDKEYDEYMRNLDTQLGNIPAREAE